MWELKNRGEVNILGKINLFLLLLITIANISVTVGTSFYKGIPILIGIAAAKSGL